MSVHDEIVYELPEHKANIDTYSKFFKTRGCPDWFNKKLIDTEIQVNERYGK